MKTWITTQNGTIDRIRQTNSDTSPGAEWIQMPDDFNGAHGDAYPDWFDKTNHRISDEELVKQGKRKDNRGKWNHKENIGETKIIYGMDEEPGEEYTKEEPLKDEPYQKWDKKQERFVVDAAKKREAEKEQKISEKQAEIEQAQKKLERPVLALANPDITAEEKSVEQNYYSRYNAELEKLREEKRALSA